MTSAFARFRILLLPVVMFFTGMAQVPAEVVSDVKVLEVDRSSLRNAGVLPQGASSIVLNVTGEVGRALSEAPNTKVLQSFQLTTVGESAARFRVASRVQSTQPLDAGVDFQLVSKVSLKHEISIRIVSQVRVLSEIDGGADTSLVFSGQAVTQQINTADGATVLTGGFVTGIDAARLAKIKTLQMSPLFNYVFSAEDANEPEIVVLLTPHITRPPTAATSVDVRSREVPHEVPVPQPPARSNDPAPQYTVQVGAFQIEANARVLVTELGRRYADVTVQPISAGQRFFRVRVGRLADLQAATQLQKQLSAEGFEAIVFRLK